MKRRAVFLDRDGVLNRAVVLQGRPYAPGCLQQLEIIPGVPEALDELRRSGYVLIAVTNQPDVSRGTLQRDVVEKINQRLQTELQLDEVLTCFHDDAAGCDCRKPHPGLLLQAAQERNLDLTDSFMVGDRWRDVEAGRRAGCRTFFIDYGYDERQPVDYDFRVFSLAQVAARIRHWSPE